MNPNEDESQFDVLTIEDKYVISIDSSDLGRLQISVGNLKESTNNPKVPWRMFKGIKIHFFTPPNGKKVMLYKFRADKEDEVGMEKRIMLLEGLEEKGPIISSEELLELLEEDN